MSRLNTTVASKWAKVVAGDGQSSHPQVHIYGLDGSDGTCLGRGNTLLQTTHFFSQCRLVTHRRRHTAQQCRYFGTGQSVTVDVVDEEQYVATFTVFVFSSRKYSAIVKLVKATRRRLPGGSFHLAIHHGYFIQYVGIFHLVVEVVTFTGTFTHTCEHGQTAVRFWRCC